jgi:hypothetical protein
MDAATGTFEQKSMTFRLGTIALHGEIAAPIAERFSLGTEIGIGVPFQKPEFDHTFLYLPPAGAPNILEGDYTVGAITTLPLMVKLTWKAPVHKGEISVSLGGGAVLMMIGSETTDQWWTDGSTPNANKLSAGNTRFARVISYGNDTIALPVLQVAPAYSFGLSERTVAGIEIPLALAARRSVSGEKTDPFSALATTNGSLPITELGGFIWNVLFTISAKL